MSTEALACGLGTISRLSKTVTRSITAENVYGEKGCGGMAEMSAMPHPCITLSKGSTTTLLDL